MKPHIDGDKGDGWSPVRELRESVFLLALTVSSMAAYVGLGIVAVRLIATVR
jgi:hypothetical protein